MYQRIKILQTFREAGLEKTKNKKMQAFLRYLSENPQICWPEATKEFREKYFDIYDDIVSLILRTEDALIISNLLRHIDMANEKEASPVNNFIRNADAFRNEATFKVMVERHYTNVADIIHQKAMLPQSVLSELSTRKRELVLSEIKQPDVKTKQRKADTTRKKMKK